MRQASEERLDSSSRAIAVGPTFPMCKVANAFAKSLFWRILGFKLLGLRILAVPSHIENHKSLKARILPDQEKKNSRATGYPSIQTK